MRNTRRAKPSASVSIVACFYHKVWTKSILFLGKMRNKEKQFIRYIFFYGYFIYRMALLLHKA